MLTPELVVSVVSVVSTISVPVPAPAPRSRTIASPGLLPSAPPAMLPVGRVTKLLPEASQR
jgi:hypothetical protein